MKASAHTHGFTIVETVVAAVIFLLAVGGVFAALGGIVKPSTRSDRSLQAAYIGQQVLEGLRVKVEEGTWDSAELAEGTHYCPTINNTIGNYSCAYDVVEDPNSGARQVTMNITWQ